MNTALEDYVFKKVWCEPIQDRQHVFKMHRTSKKDGNRGSVEVSSVGFSQPLPRLTDRIKQPRFHLFTVGRIDLLQIGLESLEKNIWINLPSAMEQCKTVLEVSLANGTLVPARLCYLKVGLLGAISIAVEIDRTDYGTYRLHTGDLFLRSYHNSYLMSGEYFNETDSSTTTPVRYLSKYIGGQSDYFLTLSQIGQNQLELGNAFELYYADGFLIKPPQGWLESSYLGKTLGVLFDTTIDRIEFHRIQTLTTFDSDLDESRRKYLLVSDSDLATYIEFCDDLDIYVVNGPSPSQYKGVQLNRFYKRSVRQVTHNSWSIDADQIDALISQHDFLSNQFNNHLMVVVRKASIKRGLPYQYNNVNELYKMIRSDRLLALNGVNSSMPEWNCRELENSAYCQLMRAFRQDIDKELIADALGYHVVTSVMEPVLLPVLTEGNPTELPDVYQQTTPNGLGVRSVFVYGPDRTLAGYYTDNSTSSIESIPNTFTDPLLMEVFHARINEVNDGVMYNQNVTDTEMGYWGFRVYVCPIVSGIPNGEWTDVTEQTPLYYSLSNGQITWNWGLLNANGLYPAYRRNGHIHVYRWPVPASLATYSGKLEITVTAQSLVGGVLNVGPSLLPPGKVDVFMDGLILIHGLDYQMQWPKIYISKRPLGSVTDTEIVVRSYGVSGGDEVAPYIHSDYGWVKDGFLSFNDRYNVRDAKSLKINVGGRLFLKSEVSFAEGVLDLPVTDGFPYFCDIYRTPVEPYLPKDTVDYLQKSTDVDFRTEDYLSLKIEQPELNLPTVYLDRYRLFSPFLNYIIHGMLYHGMFPDSQLNFRYGNVEVESWIATFKYLLDYDPAFLGVDDNYVVIYPHQYTYPVELSSLQFGFLSYLIRNYLSNRVQLSQSVNIGV